jgi:protein-disulfide isomerase
MTHWKLRPSLGFALAALLVAPVAPAQQQSIEDLKKDIEILKEGQKAIQKDMQEIKALLLKGQPAQPPQAVDLDLGSSPSRGERTAKLTLVEFSDYQ